VACPSFELSSRPLDASERSALLGDLDQLGADATLLDLYTASLNCRNPTTRPFLLRGTSSGALIGVALVHRCRDYGVSLFASPWVRRTVVAGPPIWYWDRSGLGTDGVAGPGLVTAGIDREAFADAAIQWLARRHVAGAIVERAATPRPQPSVDLGWLGVSELSVTADTRADLVAAHKNLARKLRRFENRGGTIERLRGPIPIHLRGSLLRGYDIVRPMDPPFRSLYPAMVDAHWSIPSDRVVHLIARSVGSPVGYHSFLHTGSTLSLLSGAFDRVPDSAPHAYESVLMASVDLAVDLGCTVVHYGPAVNEVKRSLLQASPTRLRFVSLVPPVRSAIRAVWPRTRLARGQAALLRTAPQAP